MILLEKFQTVTKAWMHATQKIFNTQPKRTSRRNSFCISLFEVIYCKPFHFLALHSAHTSQNATHICRAFVLLLLLLLRENFIRVLYAELHALSDLHKKFIFSSKQVIKWPSDTGSSLSIYVRRKIYKFPFYCFPT